jgi:hypothetical protein
VQLSNVYVFMSYLIENICGLYGTGKWNWIRSTARIDMGIFQQFMGKIKKWVGSLIALKHGTWVDGYSCLRLHSPSQVGYC